MGSPALPLPVPPASPDDAVRFIDLSGYPYFFEALDSGFPAHRSLGRGPSRGATMSLAPTLVAHDVGAFEASFVPALADFDRLDARFRLPPQTWGSLPSYRDHGFAVFKLDRRLRGSRGCGRRACQTSKDSSPSTAAL